MINKDNDDFEKELFKFAKNDKEVPIYVDKAINDAINRVKPTAKVVYKFRRVAIIIISFSIITASIVYGKEIVKFFKAIFTNSTPGIDAAIENGYIQNIDMNFIYDNGIGVKVNNIVKDDEILDIGFAFDCGNKKNIENIELSDFCITVDGNVIFSAIQGSSVMNKISSMEILNDIKFEDNLYYKSILCRFDKNINYNYIEFEISKINIYENNKCVSINGKWKVKNYLNVNDEKEVNCFNTKYDNSILEITNEIKVTNFIIDIKFKEDIDSLIISEYGNIRLTDESKNEEIMTESSKIDEQNNHIILEYDYGKYNFNDKLNLYIKYNNEKETYIELYK